MVWQRLLHIAPLPTLATRERNIPDKKNETYFTFEQDAAVIPHDSEA